MKTKIQEQHHLPLIEKLPMESKQNKDKGRSVCEKNTELLRSKSTQRQSQIFKLLQQVRKTINLNIQNQQSIEQKTKSKQERERKKQNELVKKQRKIYHVKTETPNLNQVQNSRKLTSFIPSSIQVQQVQSLDKPPHRTKMVMCIQGQKLYLYGGLGCERNLRLAVLDLRSRKWSYSEHQNFAQYIPTSPLIGHSFGCYKGKGYIYGGSSNDVLNELSIANLKDLKFTEGQRCQFRRKNHAMIMISKYMIIHGGIESNQVKNTIYYYNTETNTWIYPNVSATLPFLSSHGMASTFPLKTKKKQISSLNQLQDPIYLFGGQDKKGEICNSLYKVVFQNDNFTATKIQVANSPSKRLQMCFQYAGNNMILLYGGKLDIEDEKQPKQDQFTNQVYGFNTEKQQWMHFSTLDFLPDRYGMASANYNGKVYIFGGFIGNKYANADITIISVWNPDIRKSKSNIGTKAFTYEKNF